MNDTYCPTCGGDVRRCCCAASITAMPTTASLTPIQTATMTRYLFNLPPEPPRPNRAQRRAMGKRH